MHYHAIKDDNDTTFKRLTGIDKHLFAKMVQVAQTAYQQRKRKGCPHSLSFED